jgi:hypothetical protein
LFAQHIVASLPKLCLASVSLAENRMLAVGVSSERFSPNV